MKPTALLFSLCALLLPACGGGGGDGAGNANANNNTPPTVTVSAPAADATVEAGTAVTVNWTANDPDDTATTDVFADIDGDLGTAADQVAIVAGIAENNGVQQTTQWDTSAVPPGTYFIVARTSDGVNAPVLATAPGRITVEAAAAPVATIEFPPPVALTDGATVTVRGVATDTTTIASVTVNGAAATSGDGFQTWTANVALAFGANAITIATADTLGNADATADTATVTRDANAATTGTVGSGTAFSNPQDIVIDSNNDRLLMVDDGIDELVAVDMETGNRTTISSAVVGAGTNFASPVSLVLDLANSRALVADGTVDVIFAVDLSSGNRTELFDSNDGAGNNFPSPDGMFLDSANGRLLLCETIADGIVEIDVATGVRANYTGSTGAGNALDQPTRLIFDSGNARTLVINRVNTGSLVSVDDVTGDRTIVSDNATGGGLPAFFQFPAGLALDSIANRVLVQMAGADALVEIDLTTGFRAILSDDATGVGPVFSAEQSLAFDASTNVCYVIDTGTDAVYAVDVIGGDRVFFSK